jgi:hypothetical protein
MRLVEPRARQSERSKARAGKVGPSSPVARDPADLRTTDFQGCAASSVHVWAFLKTVAF